MNYIHYNFYFTEFLEIVNGNSFAKYEWTWLFKPGLQLLDN